MVRGWYYSHKNERYGPVTSRQIKRLAGTGGLMPEDLVWPEGMPPDRAVAAETVLDFAVLRRAAQEARHRGEDSSSTKPVAATPADEELPGWREDLDLLFREPEQAVGPVPEWLQGERLPLPSVAGAGLPDWMSEKSPSPAPAPPAPPAREPSAPAPQPPPTPAKTAAREAPPPVSPPLAMPVGPSTGSVLLEGMGIDPATGRVVDPTKFAAWQGQQGSLNSEELPPPRDYDPDPFRTARKQLASWVSQEKNQERLARGERAQFRQDPVLIQYLRHFEKYGSEKCKNLWDYLEFLLDNRTGR